MPTLDKYQPGPPIIDLPEEAWREIEATLGLEKPDAGLRRRVARYVSMYLYSPEADIPQLRPGDMRKRFKQIQTRAKALRDALELEGDEHGTSKDAWAKAAAIWSLLTERQRKALSSSLSALVTEADEALRMLPQDKGGRQRDWLFYSLICALASAYEIATDRRPTITLDPDGEYRGPFFDFVYAVLHHFAPQKDRTDLALGKTIQRALKYWRHQRGEVMDTTKSRSR